MSNKRRMTKKERRREALRKGREKNPDVTIARLRTQLRDSERDKKRAVAEAAELHERLDLALGINDHVDISPIVPKKKRSSKRKAAAVACASDWHIEEEVIGIPYRFKGEQLVNTYNLDISKRRSYRFFEAIASLLRQHAPTFQIDDLVIWFGGDVITGYLREEDRIVNLLSPTEAMVRWIDYASSGLDFLLAEFPSLKIRLEFSFGNHDRISDRPMIAAEGPNSYAWMAYCQLANRFEDEPRISCNIPRTGIHYSQIYGLTVRWHHGHYIQYRQGVLGLGVPAGKKIAGWDKGRQADLTVIGHFHQLGFYPRFITNGSLIGPNPYAQSLACDPEPPQQAFFLVDEKRGVIMQTKIWVTE